MKRDVVFHHAKFVDERRSQLLPGDVLDLSNEDRYRLTRTMLHADSISVHGEREVVDPAELAVHGQLGNN